MQDPLPEKHNDPSWHNCEQRKEGVQTHEESNIDKLQPFPVTQRKHHYEP